MEQENREQMNRIYVCGFERLFGRSLLKEGTLEEGGLLGEKGYFGRGDILGKRYL